MYIEPWYTSTIRRFSTKGPHARTYLHHALTDYTYTFYLLLTLSGFHVVLQDVYIIATKFYFLYGFRFIEHFTYGTYLYILYNSAGHVIHYHCCR